MKYRVAALLLSVLLLTACGEEQTELTSARRLRRRKRAVCERRMQLCAGGDIAAGQ